MPKRAMKLLLKDAAELLEDHMKYPRYWYNDEDLKAVIDNLEMRTKNLITSIKEQ